MMNKSLEIWILSYQRPSTIVETIDSILSQNYPFRLIISENSPSDAVLEVLKQRFPDIEVRRRSPSLPVFDHINLVMSEVRSDYFMMFHDDDILLPGAVETLMKEFAHNIVAVCGNGFIKRGESISKDNFNISLNGNEVIRDEISLINKYLEGYRSINPFPGYIYSASVANTIRFGTPGIGKYSDVSFLLDILSLGFIKWLTEPCIVYRIHDSNDSQAIDLSAMKSLCELFKNVPGVNEGAVLSSFFYTALVDAVRTKKRSSIVFVFKFYINHPFLCSRVILKKIFKK